MKYVCQICGYVYDESKEKIPFDKLEDDWKCPLCKASKSEFKAEEEPKAEEVLESFDDLVKLDTSEMGAICSNLAKSCEKQYMKEEMSLFNELAAYFDSITPYKKDCDVSDILKLINKDLEEYSTLKDYCLSNSDRGAARVSVWGERVTRMLSSLLNRYLKEGDKMVENTEIWVCTVCGFVYIGDNPPEACPVCKVPSWKFECVEGLK